MTSPEKRAEVENTLKGDKGALERAVRALVRAQTDLTGALDGLAALDGLDSREDVAIQAEHLRTECTNVDALLTDFERTAAESEITAFKADQDAWGDSLYRCQKLLAKAQVKLSRPLPGAEAPPPGAAGVEAPSPGAAGAEAPLHGAAGVEAPPPGADGVQATSPGGAPDPGQPTAAASGSGQGAAVDISGQVSRLLTLLETRETNAGSPSSASGGGPDSTHAPSPLQCKLPKLEIPKFGGDYLKWYSFWDRFTAAVDCRDRIAPVDKLNYLVGMLENEPLKYIQTLPLTNDTYDVAKAMLQSKYGDKKMIVSLLYRRLNEMRTVRNHPAALREFVAEIDCLMGSLGSMGQDVQDDNFATIILSKLPPAVVIMLEMTKEVKTDWSVTLVREKLSDYLVRLDRTTKIAANGKGPGPAIPYDFTGDSFFAGDGGAKGSGGGKGRGSKGKGGTKAGKFIPPPRIGGPAHQGQGGSQIRKPWCAYCGGSHYPDNCTRYKTADERFRQVGDRCRLCLKPDHQKSQCQSQKPCYHCKAVGSHHSSMCFNKFGKGGDHSHFASSGSKGGAGSSGGTGGGSGQNGTGPGSGSNSQPPMSLLASGEGVALQTAKIPVQSGPPSSNTFVVTRSLFDPGSNRTYGSRHLARKLKLKTRHRAPLKVNRFGADGAVTIPTETAELRVRQLDGSIVTLEVAIIPQITGSLVRAPVQSQNFERLKTRVRLADDVPTDFEATDIDLLIGNDYYLDFITCDKIEVDPGLYLLGSEFGYILSGRTPLGNPGGHSMSMCAFTCGVLEGLDEVVSIPKADDRMMKKPDMSDLWALDKIGIHDSPEVTSDDLAAQNFQQNVKFENGRYWVSLPKNDRAGDLESNFMLSKGRLKSLVTKKLHRDPKLFGAYQEIIQDQLAKGVIETVDSSVPAAPVHYIPHHPVVTPQKETTKVRVVYDGSAKVRQDSPSLNECLHRGPVLLEDMVGLLLRFRTPKYAIVSDIEKAFLQIGIIPEDRDLLRFLWLKDPKKGMVEGNLQVYRFCRVLFGLNCSPSLLLQTVRHHLGLVGTPVAKQISENLYADNVITGVDSVADGERFYSEAKGVFRRASMNLRQWSSNSADLMAVIPPEDQIKARNSKVLGLEWNRDTDLLVVSASDKLRNPAATKREFLSQLATVFDPLGFFSPVTMTGKILLQAACESKPDWDTKLSDSSIAEWDEQRKRLLEIPTQPIPRYLPMHGKCMLVAFADASTSSFAAAVYLRTETSTVNVGLLMAKTRLNPVKKLTVPRLELLAILIAVRAINFVATHLSLPKADGVVFSDSKVALAWLCSQKKQDVFVRNRVKEIAKSNWLKFRYVNTVENPADLPTRGRRATELDSFWWNGPQFLRRPRHEWPDWDTKEVVAQEVEPPAGSIHEMSLVATPDRPLDISRFSSHLRLIRVTAWCLRFRDRVKKMGGSDKCLSAEELSRAQKLWETQTQSEAYNSVKEALGHKSSVALGQLSVFQDSEGLLRCRGRMAKADLSWETKFPKLLPKSHPYTRLIVDRIHKEGGHPSVTHTVARVQQKYWIPKGRQLVKSVVHNCVVCRKAAGRAFASPPITY